MVWTSYLGLIVMSATAGFFVFSGIRIANAFETSVQARPVIRHFGLYWILLGASALAGVLLGLVALADADASATFLRALYTARVGLALAGVASFVYYLAYLFTGASAIARGAYAVYALSAIASMVAAWQSPATDGAHTPLGTPFPAAGSTFVPSDIAWLLAVAPVILGTIGLFVLGLRTGRVYSQYRCLLVSGALVVWSLSGAALASAAAVRGTETAGAIAALVAAVAVYIAYFPPRPVATRLEQADARRRARALGFETMPGPGD